MAVVTEADEDPSSMLMLAVCFCTRSSWYNLYSWFLIPAMTCLHAELACDPSCPLLRASVIGGSRREIKWRKPKDGVLYRFHIQP